MYFRFLIAGIGYFMRHIAGKTQYIPGVQTG